MNKSFVKGIMVLLILPVSGYAAETDYQAAQTKYLDDSRNTAIAFKTKLGGILKAQLETAGTESAIGVCKQISPAMAAEYSKNGRVVKRVSLKARNPLQGTPDDWEKQSLEGFNQAKREGKPLDTLEASAVSSDGRWFRYMKAIPTQAQCLQCHGKPSDISASVKALLRNEYPNDQAVGYSAGEIRGAISISHQLNITQ